MTQMDEIYYTRGVLDVHAEIEDFEEDVRTPNQTDAIELIYALKASASVNNGNIDIATLVAIFEFILKMELKEYYHKFTYITCRKKDITIFFNKLKDGFLHWIDGKMA